MAGSYGQRMFNFLGNYPIQHLALFSKVDASIYISTSSIYTSSHSMSSPTQYGHFFPLAILESM